MMQVKTIMNTLRIFTMYPNFLSLNVDPLTFLLLFIIEQIIGIPLATFIAITEHPRNALNALVEINENVPSTTEVTATNNIAFLGTCSFSDVISSC